MTKDWTFGRFFLPKAKPSGRCAPAGRGSAGNAKTLEFQRFSTIRPPDFPAVPHDFPTVHPARAPPRAPSKDDIHVTNVQTDPKDHSSRLPVLWTRARAGLGGEIVLHGEKSSPPTAKPGPSRRPSTKTVPHGEESSPPTAIRQKRTGRRPPYLYRRPPPRASRAGHAQPVAEAGSTGTLRSGRSRRARRARNRPYAATPRHGAGCGRCPGASRDAASESARGRTASSRTPS